MSSVKTVATFAIIIGCFAVLYPKFLHPMMTRIFGLQNGKSPYYPPGRKPDDRPPPHMPQHQAADMRQHMRPGPHPGMRAAADMHRQQSQHGAGRGMMGIVLPMYAVGIVLYLVYTLVKVFGKKDQSLQSEDNCGNYSRTSPADPLSPQQKTQQLQNLLLKADDKTISNEEMKELQRRLEETESQMSQILQAMQLVQNKIGSEVVDKMKTTKEEGRKAADSSPDMDSYEIVNKSGNSDSKGGESNATTPDVDSIKSEATTTTTTEEQETSSSFENSASVDSSVNQDSTGQDVENVGAGGGDGGFKMDSEELGGGVTSGAKSETEQMIHEEVIHDEVIHEEVIPDKQEDSDSESNVRHRQTQAQDPH